MDLSRAKFQNQNSLNTNLGSAGGFGSYPAHLWRSSARRARSRAETGCSHIGAVVDGADGAAAAAAVAGSVAGSTADSGAGSGADRFAGGDSFAGSGSVGQAPPAADGPAAPARPARPA